MLTEAATPCFALSGPRLCNVLHRRRRILYILVVPRQVSLVTIAYVARPRDAVILVGIDNQLRINAQTAQRLIHLLATLDRDVEIAFAAKKQRRGLNPI